MKNYFSSFFLSEKIIVKINLFVSFFALCGSFFFQYAMNYVPCTLCTLQRLSFLLILIISALSIAVKVRGFIVHTLSFLFLLSGSLFSIKQVYLQKSPDTESILCDTQSTKSIYQMTSSEIFQNIFSGSPSCSQVSYYFLSFSLAEWSLVIFIVLLFLNLYSYKRGKFN